MRGFTIKVCLGVCKCRSHTSIVTYVHSIDMSNVHPIIMGYLAMSGLTRMWNKTPNFTCRIFNFFEKVVT